MPEPSVFVASNAGQAHSKGIEAEIKARLIKGLDIIAQLEKIGYCRRQLGCHLHAFGKNAPEGPDFGFHPGGHGGPAA